MTNKTKRLVSAVESYLTDLRMIRASVGETTFDIYLNSRAYSRNVPAVAWTYKLGGYQVPKNWLSYREWDILRRPLLPDEIQQYASSARRIAAIVRYMIT